jgi:hypothetical protein
VKKIYFFLQSFFLGLFVSVENSELGLAVLVGYSNIFLAAESWRRDLSGLLLHIGYKSTLGHLSHKDDHSADPQVHLIPIENFLPQAIPQFWPPK